jgi:hypothetical protein
LRFGLRSGWGKSAVWQRTHAARRAENGYSITSLAPGWKRNRHIDAKRLGGRTMDDHFGDRRLHHGSSAALSPLRLRARDTGALFW